MPPEPRAMPIFAIQVISLAKVCVAGTSVKLFYVLVSFAPAAR